MGGFGGRIDEVRKTYNNAMNCFLILKEYGTMRVKIRVFLIKEKC